MKVNAGSICEQYIGQHLLFSQQPYCEPEVYYWVREKKNSSAEVDYVISEGTLIVPIEVKAGKSGTLKSLHLFLSEKHRSFGVRFNSDIPSILESQTALADRPNIPYRLLSLPLYMVGQVRRLIRL
jgi:predicted AAA+ superfamily ATPase